MFIIPPQGVDNGDALCPLGRGGGGGICLVTSIRGVCRDNCVLSIEGGNKISLPLGSGGGKGILSTLVDSGDETIASASKMGEGGIATSF